MDSQSLVCWFDKCWQIPFVQEGIALGIFALSLVVRNFFARWIVGLVYRLFSTQKGKENFHHVFVETLTPPLSMVFVIAGIMLSLNFLNLPSHVMAIGAHILSSVITFTVFWTLYRLADRLSLLLERSQSSLAGKVSEELRHFLVTLSKTLLTILGIMSVLEGWGINVGAFLGGLGLLTAAVGFAAKDSIANLFGSLAIFMDQSLRKGDWIKVGDIEGIVERIGLRTTTLRQFDKAQTSLPNIKLAEGAVANYSKMTYRRVKWEVGVRYDTPSQTLQHLTTTFKTYLEAHADVETDDDDITTIVRTHEFGDYAINLLICFYIRPTSAGDFTRVKEECLLTFKKIIEESDTDFAFPSRSLYMEKKASNNAR